MYSPRRAGDVIARMLLASQLYRSLTTWTTVDEARRYNGLMAPATDTQSHCVDVCFRITVSVCLYTGSVCQLYRCRRIP